MTSMTHVIAHISTADSGEVHSLLLEAETGKLVRHHRLTVGSLVMPLATSPDGGFLYAAVRSEPFRLVTLAANRQTGELTKVAEAPLPFSMTAISVDRSGHWLLATSYADGAVTVSPIESGMVHSSPTQIIESGKYSHDIKVDATNETAYAPCLGEDKIAQFRFHANSGHLEPIPAAEAPKGHGPRHMVFSPDNRYAFVLNELTGMVLRYTRDAVSGALHPAGQVSSLPYGSCLVPGVARPAFGATEEAVLPENPVYAADIDISADGCFLFTTERTDNTLSVLSCSDGNLKLTTALSTEQHPCAIKVDPSGRLLIATGAESANATVYSIDQDTGRPATINRVEVGMGASSIVISGLAG